MERGSYRIGIARERAPLSPRGDFELDLPTGSHLVLVQHRVGRSGAAAVREEWYAYAEVGEASVERLRGVGGVTELPVDAARPGMQSRAFDRFRALAGRETGIRGVWVRQIVLENPAR